MIDWDDLAVSGDAAMADYIAAENTAAEVRERTQNRAREIHLRAHPEYPKRYASERERGTRES